jgi:hypothetical protein
VNYLEKRDELLHKEDFTNKEDDLILKYFEVYPHDWNAIAKQVETKSAA